jgi:hypothetical protein
MKELAQTITRKVAEQAVAVGLADGFFELPIAARILWKRTYFGRSFAKRIILSTFSIICLLLPG